MRKGMMTLAVLGTLAVASTSIYAFGRDGSGMGRGQGFSGNSYMQQELKLTDQQQDQIFKISQEFRQKMYDNRKNPDKITVLRDEHVKAIEGILTADQKAKFATLQKERGSRRGPCGRGNRW
jgi:Spy/CpxP family protein refolding chaperone